MNVLFYPYKLLVTVTVSHQLDYVDIQGLGLWNMAENKLLMPLKETVYALAVSKRTSGLIVSAGHNDNVVKIWK